MIRTKVDTSNIDAKSFHKMLFIFNCVEKGWNVKNATANTFSRKTTTVREKFLWKTI